jgi:diguanylate cyclase (GGDEF)-like protein/PAS domain S-box-containing protein
VDQVTRPPISLRRIALTRISALAVAITLLVAAGFAGLGLLPMAEQIAKDKFDSATVRVDAELDAVFAPPRTLLEMSRDWLDGQAPALDSADAFNHLFLPVLQNLPQISSVVAGTSTGQGWLLLKQADGSLRNRMTDIPRWGLERHLLIDHLPDGSSTSHWSQQRYDARERTWFTTATNSLNPQAVHWTAPYAFFTTGDPGITASTLMRLRDGRDLVLGFDLKLRDLSWGTLHASVGKQGLALVITEDERVLALPMRPSSVAEADWLKQVLKPVSDLGLAPVTDALAAWHRAGRQAESMLRYTSGTSPWLASIRPYALGEQWFLVLILAPTADFAPAWLPILLALAITLMLTLGLAIGVARWEIVKRVTQPLDRLAKVSQQIGQLDFRGRTPVSSGIIEIRQLASAQNSMLELLGNNQQELERRAEALRDKVANLMAAEEKLQFAASVFTCAREGIAITDADGGILDVNGSFTRITGYSREEVLGHNPRILKSGRQTQEFYAGMWHALTHKGDWYGELWNRRKDGEEYAQQMTISAVRNPEGAVSHYVALFSDITALKEHQRELEHTAHFDALTGLPNRVLLADRLHQSMVQALRRSQRLAVAYIDLDGFKKINDSHGHEVGDQLLVVVSDRMKQALRESDTLARLGGDEFVAVLLDLSDADVSEPLLSRLLAAAAEPVQVGDQLLQVSASVGVTFFPQSEVVDADLLLRQADQAMYEAKQSGKNRYYVFDPERDRNVRGHHESIERIRLAMSEREFVLYYQPQVNMHSGLVVGAEALIRWQHPEQGLLAPAVFLPVIEDHPLAIDIGEWVIDTALRQLELWHAAGLNIPVSVNVGARQLQQSGFVERLRQLLAAHPLVQSDQLKLEVLETSALADIARVTQVIEECRKIGVNFALDDFGTGYSSLTYLKRLPVALLKIDQSFVRDMLDDPDDLSILNGVLGLAKAFHREVIAEGVETVAHGTLLLQLGCELAQGYGIARPMPAADMPGWSANWRLDPAWESARLVRRADLPLLFAAAELRAWTNAMKTYLDSERGTPPPLSIHKCHLGFWLDTEGCARFASQAAFIAIVPLHEQVHALLQELCDLHVQGQNQQALARLPELHHLRDLLLGQLDQLTREDSR